MNKDTLYTQTPLILDNPPSNVTDIEALYGAFIVSLTLLFVISFIKYFIGTDIKRKEVINIMWFMIQHSLGVLGILNNEGEIK